ncbi:MAG: hypothetical protein M0T70_13415 [Geobacteraceae bacterium]|nr:hypothetical protein [Geobacteraceae bacterium]
MPPPPNTTRFVLLSLLFVLAWNFTSSLVGRGWTTAAIIAVIMTSAYTWYARRNHDPLLGRILLFGLATGWTELLADRWLVDTTATLVYQPGGPFVLRSPLYMPFAWMIVTTQLGYFGWWLGKRWGVPAASLLMALFGAVNIPLYEQWAKSAGWWYYRMTPMLGNTPWYIIGGEFLIALSLPAAISVLEKRHWTVSIVAGIGQGLWIWVSYALAFRLCG